ncbi:MAG TPA: PAS domain S-box protein, partial [Bacteroidota bacterium]|nr:PAS domain S-box protein [Bacteroidota bacterium]
MQLLSDIVRQMVYPFIVFEPGGQIVASNRAFERLSGYNAEELRSMTIMELRESPSRKVDPELIAKVISSDAPVRLDRKLRTKSGEILPVEVVIDVFRNSAGEAQFFYAFHVDLRSRRSNENELRKVIDAAPNALVMVD